MKTFSSIVRHRSGVIGMVIITLLALTALLAPYITDDPVQAQLLKRNEAPSAEHWLGTDHLGRDILSRVVWGARISIKNGLTALALGATAGILIGSVASYLGGNFDRAVMRVIDVLLAFPTLLLAVMTVAILGPGTMQTAIAIGIALIAPFARLSRGEVMRVKNWDFVESARASGAKGTRIVARHILPNIISPIIVYGTLHFGTVILAEASLSFLGLGASPPTPSWGLMVNDGLQFIRVSAWLALIPGIAIFVAVLGVNLLGDALRDVLDPSIRKR